MEQELTAYFAGDSADFSVALTLHGQALSRAAWQLMRRIPVGESRDCAELARTLGKPDAASAIALARDTNPIALLIPCHRVVNHTDPSSRNNRRLWRKQKLIELEQHFTQVNPGGIHEPAS